MDIAQNNPASVLGKLANLGGKFRRRGDDPIQEFHRDSANWNKITYRGRPVVTITKASDLDARIPSNAILCLAGGSVAACQDETESVPGHIAQRPRSTVLRKFGSEASPPLRMFLTADMPEALKPFRRYPICFANDAYLRWALQKENAVLIALFWQPGDKDTLMTQWTVDERRLSAFKEIRLRSATAPSFEEDFAAALAEARGAAAGKAIYVSAPIDYSSVCSRAGASFVDVQPLRKLVSGHVELGYMAWSPKRELLIPGAIVGLGLAAAAGVVAWGEHGLRSERAQFDAVAGQVKNEYKEGEKALALLNAKKSYLDTSTNSYAFTRTLRKILGAASLVQGAVLIDAVIEPKEEMPGYIDFTVKIGVLPVSTMSAVEQGEEPLRIMSSALGVPLFIDKPGMETVPYISRSEGWRTYSVKGSLRMNDNTQTTEVKN